MSIVAFLVGLLLFGLTVYAVALPWRCRANRVDESIAVASPSAPDELARLAVQREALYAALADLDFDRKIGKLNEDDYQRMRGQLMAQTVAVLQEIDAQAANVESQAETLVRARRAQAARNGYSAVHCPSCGASTRTDDRFCGRCGTELGHRCPSCGAGVKASDLFCVCCGSTLAMGSAPA